MDSRHTSVKIVFRQAESNCKQTGFAQKIVPQLKLATSFFKKSFA